MNAGARIRVAQTLLAAVGVGALAAFSASPAIALPRPSDVSLTPSSTSVEYGTVWSIEAVLTNSTQAWPYAVTGSPFKADISIDGEPYSESYFYTNDYITASTYVAQAYDVPPLDAGVYEISVVPSGGDPAVWTGAGQLEVKPAEIATSVRISSDPATPQHVILNASLGGNYVAALSPEAWRGPSSPTLPAGNWRITVVDESDEVVFAHEIPQDAAGAPVLSAYWTGAQRGKEYWANAEFTPVAESAQNFAMTPAESFPFTGAATERVASTVVVADGEIVAPSAPIGIPIPLWGIAALGLAALALLALLVVLSVRFLRTRRLSRKVPASVS